MARRLQLYNTFFSKLEFIWVHTNFILTYVFKTAAGALFRQHSYVFDTLVIKSTKFYPSQKLIRHFFLENQSDLKVGPLNFYLEPRHLGTCLTVKN